MRAGECCNTSVVIAQRSTSIVEAAQLMREFHVGALVVVDPDGGTARQWEWSLIGIW